MNTASIPHEIARNILVVYDDDDIRALLGYQLQRAGYTVTSVSNGYSALNALKIQPFALLITDALMPEMLVTNWPRLYGLPRQAYNYR